MTNSNLKYFTQPAILQVIGPRRLALLLSAFDADLKASNLFLPHPNGQNDDYFSELAAVLELPQLLPERLREALFTLEAAASPENERRVWAAIKRRIPCVSVSLDCTLDRTLDLWFLAPDEFSQFTPAPPQLQNSKTPPLPSQPDSTVPPSNDSTIPCPDTPPLHNSNTLPLHSQPDSTVQPFNDSTIPRPNIPPLQNSKTPPLPSHSDSTIQRSNDSTVERLNGSSPDSNLSLPRSGSD